MLYHHSKQDKPNLKYNLHVLLGYINRMLKTRFPLPSTAYAGFTNPVTFPNISSLDARQTISKPPKSARSLTFSKFLKLKTKICLVSNFQSFSTFSLKFPKMTHVTGFTKPQKRPPISLKIHWLNQGHFLAITAFTPETSMYTHS